MKFNKIVLTCPHCDSKPISLERVDNDTVILTIAGVDVIMSMSEAWHLAQVMEDFQGLVASEILTLNHLHQRRN